MFITVPVGLWAVQVLAGILYVCYSGLLWSRWADLLLSLCNHSDTFIQSFPKWREIPSVFPTVQENNWNSDVLTNVINLFICFFQHLAVCLLAVHAASEQYCFYSHTPQRERDEGDDLGFPDCSAILLPMCIGEISDSAEKPTWQTWCHTALKLNTVFPLHWGPGSVMLAFKMCKPTHKRILSARFSVTF